MDDARFDRWTRGFDARISRRGLSGLAAGALATLGLAADADAKKKKKKKGRKKASPPPPPAAPPVSPPPPAVNFTCSNLFTACGNTAVCQCRLNKNSQQVCMNTVVPPNGINFPPCQSQANCPAGQFCDAQFSQCALACAN